MRLFNEVNAHLLPDLPFFRTFPLSCLTDSSQKRIQNRF